MTVSASAPGRCGIIGNPSDMYGGLVVSCTVPARALCRLTIGRGESALEDDTLWRAAVARFPLGPCQVAWSTTVPRSSGLAGSTALLSATLWCVLALRGEAPEIRSAEGKAAFAELVRDVELREAGVVCGYQDAYMVVFGGLQLMDFAGKHPADGGPLAKLRPLSIRELPFLLVTTGVRRLSASVHAPLRERWLAGDGEVVSGMERIAELGRVGADALQAQDWQTLAEAMSENHRLVAALGGSGEAVDRLIEDCRDCGAMAAKLAGAGRGGTVIALAEDPCSLEARLRERGYTRFLRPEPGPGLRVEELRPVTDARTNPTRSEVTD